MTHVLDELARELAQCALDYCDRYTFGFALNNEGNEEALAAEMRERASTWLGRQSPLLRAALERMGTHL